MQNLNPISIGLTGGIGSGKSTIAKIFSILGVPVYFADDRAKYLMQNSEALKKEITQKFGNQAYTEEGLLNKIHLADAVFNDKKKVEWLNQLVHPEVQKDFEAWRQEKISPYVLKEAALLFETGSYQQLFRNILVVSPSDLRVHRIQLRDPHRSIDQIQHIISQQWQDELKIEKADFVIQNDEEKLLIPQVLKIHEQIMALTKSI
jgi:dephospho-CoA kinase